MKKKKTNKTRKAETTSEAGFAMLQRLYKNDSPEQIQMHLIWISLKALIHVAVGASPHNQSVMRTYDAHWKICEDEIQKRKGLVKLESDMS